MGSPRWLIGLVDIVLRQFNSVDWARDRERFTSRPGLAVVVALALAGPHLVAHLLCSLLVLLEDTGDILTGGETLRKALLSLCVFEWFAFSGSSSASQYIQKRNIQ